ncbi:Corytuberine synthase [Linum grandiflorum]
MNPSTFLNLIPNPFFFFIIIFFFPLLLLLSNTNTKKHHLPPGPKPWPILGNIPQILDSKSVHVTFSKFSQSHGPLISLKLGTQLLIVASSPASASQILKNHDKFFSGRHISKANPFAPGFLDRAAIVWAPTCTDDWRSLRTLCRTELFSPKAIESQSAIRERKVEEMLAFLLANEGGRVNVGETVFTTVFNSLCNVFFSRDLLRFGEGDDENGLKSHVRRMMDLGVAPNVADFYPFLARLDPQGTDTTTTTIEWTMAELLKNKEAMTKLREELAREIGTTDAITESNVSHLPFLNACIKETLRLHPPVPFLIPHRAQETCEVMNYTIPENCQVLVNLWAIGQDPAVWVDPFSFKPERFIDGSTGADYKGRDFEFIPFGSGRRMCPGLPMAVKQLPLILAALVNGFDWSLPDGEDPAELDMGEKFGLTLQKVQPLVLVVDKQRT